MNLDHAGLMWNGAVAMILLILYILLLPWPTMEVHMLRVGDSSWTHWCTLLTRPWLLLYLSTDEPCPCWIDVECSSKLNVNGSFIELRLLNPCIKPSQVIKSRIQIDFVVTVLSIWMFRPALITTGAFDIGAWNVYTIHRTYTANRATCLYIFRNAVKKYTNEL